MASSELVKNSINVPFENPHFISHKYSIFLRFVLSLLKNFLCNNEELERIK